MISITIPLVTTALAVGVGSYLTLVRRLRYRRLAHFNATYNPKSLSTAELCSTLTLSAAQAIVNDIRELEFPWAFQKSLQLALFRTYAFPNVSSLLQKTRQLSTAENSGRRYADTTVLLAEFLAWPLDSERASLAIARMNYLHRAHPEILPRDTLYTLMLFVTQPVEFINRFEWRTVTPLEEAASWRLWYEIGLRMGIPAETIPGSFAEMVEMYNRHEEEFMAPAESNAILGTHTMDLLLYWVPGKTAKWVGRQCVYTVCDARLRKAMLFPDPAGWVARLLPVLLGVRGFILRHLALPRSEGRRERFVNDRPGKNGRYFMQRYDNEPWYVPATLGNRWGLWGVIYRILGLPTAGTKGYGEDGYEIETVGPRSFKKVGAEAVRREAEEIRKMGGGGGCPFA